MFVSSRTATLSVTFDWPAKKSTSPVSTNAATDSPTPPAVDLIVWYQEYALAMCFSSVESAMSADVDGPFAESAIPRTTLTPANM